MKNGNGAENPSRSRSVTSGVCSSGASNPGSVRSLSAAPINNILGEINDFDNVNIRETVGARVRARKAVAQLAQGIVSSRVASPRREIADLNESIVAGSMVGSPKLSSTQVSGASSAARSQSARPAVSPLTAQEMAELLHLAGDNLTSPELWQRIRTIYAKPEEVAPAPPVQAPARDPFPQGHREGHLHVQHRQMPPPVLTPGEWAPAGTHYGKMNRDIKLPTHKGISGRHIEEFLNKLKTYGIAYGYSERDFMKQVVPLALRDQAEQWWTYKKGFEQWEVFRAAYCKKFLPSDYREILLREMNLRTQGDDESLRTFIYAIHTYFLRVLPDATDEEKLAKVINQCHPKYRTLLEAARFVTMTELEEATGRLDAVVTASERYVAPPPASNLMDPALGYKPQMGGNDKDKPSNQTRNPAQGQSQGQAQARRPPQVATNQPRPQHFTPRRYGPSQVPFTGGNAQPL